MMNLATKIRTALEREGLKYVLARVPKFLKRKGRNKYFRHVPPLPLIPYSYNYGGTKATFYIGSQREISRITREEDVYEILFPKIRSDDVFYDVGANTGPYTCLVSDLIENGHVMAFEPHPITKKRLDKNCANINGNKISTFEIGLGESNDTVGFSIPDDSVAAGTQHISEHDLTQNNVKIRRGDDFIQKEGLPVPTMIKIDIEGAELKAVKGLRKTLKKDRVRSLFIEVHLPHPDYQSIEDYGGSDKELIKYLKRLDFEVNKLLERDRVYMIHAEKRNI